MAGLDTVKELTPESYNRIIAAVRGGERARDAAERMGIDRDTFDKWIEHGSRDSLTLYGRLYRILKKAFDIEVEALFEAYRQVYN